MIKEIADKVASLMGMTTDPPAWRIRHIRFLASTGHVDLALFGPTLSAGVGAKSEADKLKLEFLAGPEFAAYHLAQSRAAEAESNAASALLRFRHAEKQFTDGSADELELSRIQNEYELRRMELDELSRHQVLLRGQVKAKRTASAVAWEAAASAVKQRIAAEAAVEYDAALAELLRVIGPLLTRMQLAAVRKVPSFPDASAMLGHDAPAVTPPAPERQSVYAAR